MLKKLLGIAAIGYVVLKSPLANAGAIRKVKDAVSQVVARRTPDSPMFTVGDPMGRPADDIFTLTMELVWAPIVGASVPERLATRSELPVGENRYLHIEADGIISVWMTKEARGSSFVESGEVVYAVPNAVLVLNESDRIRSETTHNNEYLGEIWYSDWEVRMYRSVNIPQPTIPG